MSRAESNKPRPYSTLIDGRIVWVAPGEAPPAKAKRTRLETDDEVRARLSAWARSSGYVGDYSWLLGNELDDHLKHVGLPARQFVEE